MTLEQMYAPAKAAGNLRTGQFLKRGTDVYCLVVGHGCGTVYAVRTMPGSTSAVRNPVPVNIVTGITKAEAETVLGNLHEWLLCDGIGRLTGGTVADLYATTETERLCVGDYIRSPSGLTMIVAEVAEGQAMFIDLADGDPIGERMNLGCGNQLSVAALEANLGAWNWKRWSKVNRDEVLAA